MNIKKTSLIALIALLTCDVHASTASVARAGAKRIGTTGNRATVGGKAVSLGGGSSLNKLQSNRVQSGYSPVAPTDKSNEILEAMYDEMQKVQDTFTARIEQLEKTIEDKEAEIDELKEELENTQESVQEIADGGFITEEMVATQINNAKETIKAERDADIVKIKNEIQADFDQLDNDIKSINIDGAIENKLASKGYVTTAQLAADINAVKNEIQEDVNKLDSDIRNINIDGAIENKLASKDYATTTQLTAGIDAVKNEIQEDVNKLDSDIKNINIDGAIENKLASKNYATTTQLAEDINAVKNEIQADVDQLNNNINNINIDGAIENKLASKGYATTTQLAEDINAAKAEITTARNTALESYATSADVSSAVATLATKKELQELEVGVDEERLKGIIDTELQSKDYATTTQLAADINAAKAEITTARNTALELYATSADVSSAVATLATKKELQELEVGVDKNAVEGIVDEVLATKRVISEDTPAFQEVQQQVAAMPTTYAKSSALTDLESMVELNAQGIAAADTAIKAEAATRSEIVATLATKEALNTVDGKFATLDDTIAEQLLDDEDFKKGVLSDLGEGISALPEQVELLTARVDETEDTISGLDSRFAGYATKGELGTYATKGELGGYAKAVDVEGLNTELADLKKPATLGTLLKDVDLSANTTISGLATKEALNTVDGKFATLDDTIAEQLLDDEDFKKGVLSDLGEGISALPEQVELLTARVDETEDTISGLDSRFAGYATKGELGSYAKATDVEGLNTELADLKKPATLGTLLKDVDLSTNTTISGLATKASLEDLRTPATLGTLLKDVDLSANTTISGLATKEALDTVDGKFANYVKGADFGGLLKDADLSTNSKFSALNTTVSGLGNTYATKASLEDLRTPATLGTLLKDVDLSANTTISGLDSKFVNDADLENTLDKKGYLVATELDKELANLAENKDSTFGKLKVTADEASTKATSALTKADTAQEAADDAKGSINTLSGQYTTLQSTVNSMPTDIVKSISTPGDKMYIGTWTNKKDGKLLVVTSDNVDSHLDDNKQPIFMTKDTLGTGIDNLLKDTSVKTGLHTLASDVSGLQTNVSGLSSSFTTLSSTAVTKTSLSGELESLANNKQLPSSIVTTGNLADNGIVTQSSLTTDLYDKLTNTRPDTSTGQCLIADTNLKNLLTGVASGDAEFGTCTTKGL